MAGSEYDSERSGGEDCDWARVAAAYCCRAGWGEGSKVIGQASGMEFGSGLELLDRDFVQHIAELVAPGRFKLFLGVHFKVLERR